MPSGTDEPLFNCHWDRDQPCAVGRGSCAFAGYPAWLAPYWCARVSEGIAQPGSPEDVFARLDAMTREMRALGLTVTLDIRITVGMADG